MKTAEHFWEVIRLYNQSTPVIQIIICLFIIFSVFAAYKWKLFYLPKIALSVSNLFIGLVFFLIFDRSSMGYFFAFPLYMTTGLLFLIEGIKNKNDVFNRFDPVSTAYMLLVLSYPLVSFLLGHVYPEQVLYILPCPVISLSIIIYSRYSKRSVILLILMTLWALTGLKAFIFNVLEDLILFSTSFYGIYLVIITLRNKHRINT